MKFETVPKEKWPKPDPRPPLEVFINDKFLVQIIDDKGFIRMTVNRLDLKSIIRGKPIWRDGITWDELEEIKNSVGYENNWMVEIYPPKNQTLNVANMRHLWLLETPPTYGWKKNVF